MLVNFQEMADSSRVWVYQAARPFTEQETAHITTNLTSFLENWQAHGANLKASFLIKYNQFLVLAVDEASNVATGCSIDASVHFIQQIERDLNLDLMNKMNVSFRASDQIATVSMADFKSFAANAKVNSDTIVFNNLVRSKAEFETAWEVAASQSWHARFLN